MRKFIPFLLICLLAGGLAAKSYFNKVSRRPGSVSGDVTITTTHGDYIKLTLDSNAVDSSYGTFETDWFDLDGAPAALAYAHWYKATVGTKDTTWGGDTLVFHIMTRCSKLNNIFLETLSVDTLTDTTSVSYILGRWGEFTGTGSTLVALYWGVEMWDSASDSAHHGIVNGAYIDFGVKALGK